MFSAVLMIIQYVNMYHNCLVCTCMWSMCVFLFLWCPQIAAAMNYLHSRSPPVIHRQVVSYCRLIQSHEIVRSNHATAQHSSHYPCNKKCDTYFHSLCMYHFRLHAWSCRDLKAQNVLLDVHRDAKVGSIWKKNGRCTQLAFF